MKRTRRTIECLLLLCLLVVGSLTISHRIRRPERGTHTLEVMTWNTHQMDQARLTSDNAIIDYLRAHPVDVVCLQEAEFRRDKRHLTLDVFKQTMSDLYPYTYIDFKIYNNRRQFGNVVLSRYPLIHKQTVRYDSRSNISSRCDIVVDNDTIRLITNHLESNRLVDSDWLDTLSSNEVRQTAERIGSKIRLATRIRMEQAKVVRREINESPYPVIVAGDCNTPPISRVYLRLRGFLRDCYLEGSRGHIGHTYTYHHVPLRIDYIFCSRTLEVLDCEVDTQAKQSDHHPVTARLTYTRF